MATEYNINMRGSQSNSPVRKKRLVSFDEQAAYFNPEKSKINRMLFLQALLSYQNIHITNPSQTVFTNEQIKALKQLVSAGANDPYASRTEEMADVLEKYTAIKKILSRCIVKAGSPEARLTAAIERAYSDFINEKYAEDENAKAEARLLKIAAEKAKAQQASENALAEEKSLLKAAIKERKAAVDEMQRQITDSIVTSHPKLIETFMFIDQLLPAERDYIKVAYPGLILDKQMMLSSLNASLRQQYDSLEEEKKSLIKLEADLTSSSDLIMIHFQRSQIESRDQVIDNQSNAVAEKYQKNFHATIGQMREAYHVHQGRLMKNAAEISEKSQLLKKKYRDHASEHSAAIEKILARIKNQHSQSKSNEVKSLFVSRKSLPQDLLDKTADKLSYTFWDTVPLINKLSPLKKARQLRKRSILKELAEINRRCEIADAYGLIADCIPDRVNLETNKISMHVIHQYFELIAAKNIFIIPKEITEITEVATMLDTYVLAVNQYQALSTIMNRAEKNKLGHSYFMPILQR